MTSISQKYTRGQVSVNKRISVLSYYFDVSFEIYSVNYFDVSFEIYSVRLKYIDSIGQVVKLLILRPASLNQVTKAHLKDEGSKCQQNGVPFLFSYIPGTIKLKYLFRSRKKEIIILHSTKAHVRCTIQQNGSQSESTIETSGCVTVFED